MYGESPSLSEKKEYDVIGVFNQSPITPKSHARSIYSTVTKCFVSFKSMEILRDKTIEYQSAITEDCRLKYCAVRSFFLVKPFIQVNKSGINLWQEKLN